jgi:hypothetical protein
MPDGDRLSFPTWEADKRERGGHRHHSGHLIVGTRPELILSRFPTAAIISMMYFFDYTHVLEGALAPDFRHAAAASSRPSLQIIS